jgi:uncharacterized protein YndB with AHSA1/START domain
MATTETASSASTGNKIGATTFTTPSDREIVMTRVFDAPRRLVFDAWTNPKHLPHWLLGPDGWTMTVCEIDLRPGGASRLGWRNANGSEMEIRSVYREITPLERLVSTESWGGDWADTLNTVTFVEADGKTTVTNRMLFPSREARDAALNSGMQQGVSLSYERLATYLRTLG